MKYRFLPYILLLPVFTMIVVIVFIPLITTIIYSFQSYQLTNPDAQATFIGLENYTNLLQDGRFISSLITSLIYILGSVIGMLILGLLTAQIANQAFKGRSLFRASILLPWAVAPVVAAQSWKFMFETDFGVINYVLEGIGLIERNIPWLVSSDHAMLSVIITNVWKTTPLLTLIIVSGLQTVSKELYESSDIDGAGPLKKYYYITLPLIRPFIAMGLIFTTLQTINVIDIIYVMTGGGPGESTEIFTLYNYKVFFQYLDFGLGGAMAVIGVVMVGILIFFYTRSMNKQYN
ncbi:carbohydrate ABC transporter permease [Gracilibacillus kekensis]|uniref:Carbohydrate ABC transporter membrane protein 1, CUT1 family n=1 Tax=Gracilibacillus kekensis TaxID=1027249 RepID=A0A1M7QMT8_9BACI|nr:sugar ABC transporter permease [Gracilibacillus kekensis]SHN32802.1 carbohydrate ABC transporter membrane protein 1, CUT1 family [Gracilibacillus kekensis]